MAGISIPIGGDLAPFLAIAAELRQEMAGLGRSVRAAVSPAKSETVKAVASFKALWNSTQTTNGGMKALKLTVAGLGVGFRAFQGTARAALSSVSSAAHATMRAVSGIGGGLKSMIPGGGMLGPLVGIAGAAGAIALAFSQVSLGMSTASDMERMSVSLGSLTGSAAESTKIIESMRKTWVDTGVDISSQASTIQKFIALGFKSDDAIKLQKNILNVAGAVGMSSEEAKGLGTALAQVKAKGVVSMEELRQQIAEKGVPVFEALAQKMGVTQVALIKMVEDGKVPAEELISIFMNLEGQFGRFAGGAELLGKTFGGIIGRIKGAWSMLLADFAAPIMSAIKPMLLDALALIESFKATAVNAGTAIGNAILSAYALMKSGKSFDLLKAGFVLAVTGAMDALMRGIRSAVAFLAAALPPIFEFAVTRISDPLIWDALGLKLQAIFKRVSADIRSAFPGSDDKSFDQAYRESYQMDSSSAAMMATWNNPKISGDGTKIVADSLMAGIEAAAKVMSGPASPSFQAAQDAMKGLLDSVKQEAAALKASVAIPAPTPFVNTATGATANAAAPGGLKEAMTLTTSMTRVGGSGFGTTFLPMVSETKKSNNLLTKIEKNTRNMPGAIPAIA